VRWRPNAIESRGLGVFALPHVVPTATLQFLNDDNAVIVPHLLASIGGTPVYRDHNVLDSLVRRSLALVIDRNLQANADRYGAPQFGSHLERYLVDALRRLAISHSGWVPNREKSRVWFGREGLFLLWPQSAGDVQALLEADQLPGIPKAPERPRWKPSSSRPRPFSSRESIRHPSPCPRHWNSSRRRRLRQLRRRRLHPCHRRHR
jgi:conjugal transfer pilus assembly protein TraI